MRRKLSTNETTQGKRFRRRKTNTNRSATKMKPDENQPFVLAWHPERWDILDNGELMPVFKRFQNIGGLHGLGDRQDIETIESNITNKLGWIFIHEDDGLEYVTEHPSVFGGNVYTPKWMTPKMNKDEALCDWDVLNEFIDELFDRDLIQMPTVDCIRDRLESLTRQVEAIHMKTNGQDNMTTRAIKRKIAILEDILNGTDESLPTDEDE